MCCAVRRRDRNGVLAWRPASAGPLPACDAAPPAPPSPSSPSSPTLAPSALPPPQKDWDPSAAPLAATSIGANAAAPIALPARPHSARPAAAPPAGAAASRPVSASPLHHRTATVAELEAAELQAARSNLQYRVLKQQASLYGLSTPAQLLSTRAAAARDSITASPNASLVVGGAAWPHHPRPGTAPPARAGAAHGAAATPGYNCPHPPGARALSAPANQQHTVNVSRSVEGLSAGAPPSAKQQHRLCSANGGAAQLPARPQSALPLSASGVPVQRTRPPSAGRWAGSPHLAEALEEAGECELVWSGSTSALENVPGVSVTPLCQVPHLALALT